MNPIFLDFGSFKIYWYSITMLLAISLASFLFYKGAKKQKYSDEFLTNLLFYGIIIGIIGARIYYVLFNLDYYLKNPIEIIEVWNGGLAIHGGILAGGAWFIYYSKKNNYNPFKILDIAAVSVIIGQAIGRWGNFFNGEAHGVITTRLALEKMYIPKFIINGMYINGFYYIPTFYYEFLWNLLGFIILIIVRKKCKINPGTLSAIYLMWYSFARFFIEGMRTDSLMLGSIRVAQLISVLLFIVGAVLLYLVNNPKKTRINKLRKRAL